MTSRTRTPPVRSRGGVDSSAESAERIGWADVPVRLRVAVVIALAAGVSATAGQWGGVVVDSPEPGFAAAALLAVLALAPAVVALGLVAARRPVLAAGVVVGAALLVPGRVLVDLQLAADALVVSRPELLVPTSLAPLRPATGLWLLLAGHVLLAVAGALALGRAGAAPGSPYATEFDDHSGDRSTRTRSASVLVALIAGTAAAVGLLLVPFTSDNAFQLARSVLDSPPLVRYGTLLLAVLVAGVAVVAAGSARPSVARGLVLGVTLGVAAVVVPQLVAGLAVDLLHPAPGPYLALAAMVALTALVWSITLPERTQETQVRLDSLLLHRAAGGLGLLCGVACLAAAFGTQLVVPDDLEAPVDYANRVFVPAALLVVALSAALLAPRSANAARPAFAVALVTVPYAAAGTADAAFTATGISDEVRVGAGVWFAFAAVVAAVGAAVATAIAGGVERDDVDLTERRVHTALAAPTAAAGLFAVGAFGLPVLRAPELVSPGIWHDFRFVSWGLVLALLTVLAAAAVAPLSRAPRAAALLLGAAGVMAVRLLEYPLTAGRAAGSTAGPGTWLALAALVAFVVAAVMAVAAHPRDRR